VWLRGVDHRGPVTFLQESICAAWSPPSDEPAWKWIEENVELGNDSDIKGKVSFDYVPMSRFFLDSCQNPRVKKVTKMTSAQSAKTKNVEFYLKWKIKNRPSETIWYQDDNIAAKTFVKTRLYPNLEECEAIRPLMPTRRDKKSQTLIQFDTMNLYVLGANKKTNRERITAAEVLCDEIRNYPPGAMQGIRNRYKTIRNYKEIIFSVAGVEGDILHESFEEGSRHLFFWTCPHCSHKQTFRFGRKATVMYPKPREYGGMVWDDNPVTHPSEDVWNFEELAKTVRYECENPECKHRFHNSDKLALLKTLEPIQTNPMASPEHVSMHWNEMYMPWEQCDWDKIVAKFLRATISYKRGDKEPLKVIVQETFGEPWVDEDTALRSLPITEAKPDGKKLWVNQDYIFMMVDVQRKGFWVLVQLWSKTGLDYCYWFGELRTWDEVQAKQDELSIPHRTVFVDCGDRDQEVFTECVKRGKLIDGKWVTWTAMRGEDRDSYIYIPKTGKRKGEKIRLPFSWPPSSGDPSFGMQRDNPDLPVLYGKTCPLIFWSNPWIKDIATSRRDSMERGKLSFIGPGAIKLLPKHLYSEHKQKFYDQDGREEWRYVVIGKRPNHGWDCYCMGTDAACMAKIIGEGVPD
jgi:hypothetical protein